MSAFIEYEVPGVGTVIDPEGEPGYRVRLPDGQVTAYPAISGEPSGANAAADIAHAVAHPASIDQAAIWAEKLAGRIVDADTGIPLNASIAARDILTSHLVLLREAEAAGMVAPSTPQTIWDADNVPRQMTVAELRLLIIRYGIAWQALHAEFAP